MKSYRQTINDSLERMTRGYVSLIFSLPGWLIIGLLIWQFEDYQELIVIAFFTWLLLGVCWEQQCKRNIVCPKCGCPLWLSFFSPKITPRTLPDEAKHCPACGVDFDEIPGLDGTD